MTEQELILELVAHRVKRFIAREKDATQAELYQRCGRGSNGPEFLTIVNKLIVDGVITRTVSERGKPVLQLVESQQG